MNKLLLLAAVVIACSSTTLAIIRVTTPVGKLIGRVNNNESISFFGVPYAEPPILDLRFQPPKSPWTWNYIHDGTFSSPSCVQFSSLPDSIEKKNNISENCLRLDIHIDGTSINETNKLPVLVFIHGGSFVSGSSSNFDLSKFVTGRKIIAVAIQYRLGLLGFAQSPDDNVITGNNGLQDQVAALKWIKMHISSFGGDGDQVTVAGESAGSISIAYHLVSPLAGGLIKRAILESGSHRTLPLVSPDQVENNMQQVIKFTGCNRKPKDEQYSCLREVPIENLLAAQRRLAANKVTFTPTKDSRYFGNLDPVEQVANGNFTNKLDSVIVGQNGNEGALFLAFYAPQIFPFGRNPPKKTWYSFELRAVTPFIPRMARPLWRKIVDLTFDGKLSLDELNLTNTMGKVLGDELFNCPNKDLVQSYITANPTTNVYYYHFVARPKHAMTKKLLPYIKDAIHAEELQFVYGQPLLNATDYNDKEIELSKRLINEWVTFTKTGAVADKKWLRVVLDQNKVKFSHIVFKNATETQYKTGFPKNYCKRLAEKSN